MFYSINIEIGFVVLFPHLLLLVYTSSSCGHFLVNSLLLVYSSYLVTYENSDHFFPKAMLAKWIIVSASVLVLLICLNDFNFWKCDHLLEMLLIICLQLRYVNMPSSVIYAQQLIFQSNFQISETLNYVHFQICIADFF